MNTNMVPVQVILNMGKSKVEIYTFSWYVLCLQLKWELTGKFYYVTIKCDVSDHCICNVFIRWTQVDKKGNSVFYSR